jgi:ribonuclease BN (tRNA processing enzyme)
MLGAALLPVLLAAAPPPAAAPAPVTRLVLLGTGTPNLDPDRSGPALAVVVGDSPYLVDCGAGLLSRTAAASRKRIPGLEPERLSRLFVTHLHSDHTTGLADLILRPWTLERREPLQVYGPPGIRSMVRNVSKAYREDIQVRLHGGEPSNRTGYRVVAREVGPGVVYRDDNVSVRAFRVSHGSWRDAYGYRFDSGDRSIVVSGDTRPTDAVVESCNGCDVLVHEVYSEAGLARRPAEWQRYHKAFHTSSGELARLAARARPKLLVLDHQLFWGTSEEDLLREVRSRYAGEVVSGHDLDVY